MRIPFDQMKQQFHRVLTGLSFPEKKAAVCAGIFAGNSLDGVYSHGLNRFPVFVKQVRHGHINPAAEPEGVTADKAFECWDGHLAPGMYNASICMGRAIALSKQHGMSCVTIKNTNHWMRGGTYGWQAAEAGCIGICFTNAIAGMPAWGGASPVLGNNPLVMAVPRNGGHVVLDMAMSQFSYGKLQEYQLNNTLLPVPGGFDDAGNLTHDPVVLRKNKRVLPIGYWKGSGMAMLLDMLLVALSGGRSTPAITAGGAEFGVTQCFICLHRPDLHEPLINEIINYAKASTPGGGSSDIYYPGERTLHTRLDNLQNGIPADERIWQEVLAL